MPEVNEDRERVIEAIIRDTGDTREQAEAFLDIVGSAFARRGWVEGEPLSKEAVSERLDTFLGKPARCSCTWSHFSDASSPTVGITERDPNCPDHPTTL